MRHSGREHPEQTPTEHNEEETIRALMEQDSIAGEKREKAVSDVAATAALAQILKDLEFPADKKRIVQFVEKSSRSESREILPLVRNIPETDIKTYQM